MQTRQSGTGLLLGLGAYVAWGLGPLYFKAVAHVHPVEVVCHRVVWSFLLLSAVVAWRPQGRPPVGHLRRGRSWATLLLLGGLLAVNWLIFVVAIVTNRLMEASLGYFLNPLFMVALGVVVLKEPLRPWQKAALVLAGTGVAWRVASSGGLPWIALSLAGTFSVYGLLRKTSRLGPVGGLWLETMVMTPFAVAGLLAVHLAQGTTFLTGTAVDRWLLLCAALVTTIPLLLFAAGARRLHYATMGFLQYVAPSMQFALAVWMFHEPLDHRRLVGFLLVWAGLAVFAGDLLRTIRGKRKTATVAGGGS